MIITTITYPSGNTSIQLEPEQNYKYVSDGQAFSTLVILGKNQSIENWYDTNDEPPEPSEDATIEDYENSLKELEVIK